MILSVLIAAASVGTSGTRKPALVRQPAATTAQPRKEPTAVLAEELVYNSVESQDADLLRACRAANVKGLLWALNAVVKDWPRQQGEFETLAQFQARQSKAEDTLNGTRTMLVCWRLSAAGIKYNADAEAFSVSDYDVQHVGTISKNTGSYMSSTAMGARARVHTSVSVAYDVKPSGDGGTINSTGCAAQRFGYSAAFDVPRAVAPDVKAGGYVVLLGTLVWPFYDQESRRTTATLDDPYADDGMTFTLRLRPKRLLIVGPDGTRYHCASAAEEPQAAPASAAAAYGYVPPAPPPKVH